MAVMRCCIGTTSACNWPTHRSEVLGPGLGGMWGQLNLWTGVREFYLVARPLFMSVHIVPVHEILHRQ